MKLLVEESGTVEERKQQSTAIKLRIVVEKQVRMINRSGYMSRSRFFNKKRCSSCRAHQMNNKGLVRELNPGPLESEARIIPLEQQAT